MEDLHTKRLRIHLLPTKMQIAINKIKTNIVVHLMKFIAIVRFRPQEMEVSDRQIEVPIMGMKTRVYKEEEQTSPIKTMNSLHSTKDPVKDLPTTAIKSLPTASKSPHSIATKGLL